MADTLEQQIEWQFGEILRLIATLRAVDAGSAFLAARPLAIEKMRSELVRLIDSLVELEAQRDRRGQ